jgi:S-DNA-T family DNA segregation ATPase FtsK/SpoIIIE
MAGGGRITRVHGPLVTDEEVERVVSFLKSQGQPDYIEEVTEEDASSPPLGFDGGGAAGGGSAEDQLYDQAVALVCRERKASTSFVQRHLQIGYNRAARIIERMEAEGVISRANHVGKREVLARDIDDREH